MRIRPRRNRKTPYLRDLVAETKLSKSDLILPLFVIDGKDKKQKIDSLPGHSRLSVDHIQPYLRPLVKLGLRGVALFPVIEEEKKDRQATSSKQKDNVLVQAIQEIKDAFPHLVLFTDVAMDPYSSDGHDGLVEEGEILNDESLPILCEMALVQAQAGADFVAPSDMMDGRVGAIRGHLDKQGYKNTGIMSYTAKYASAFYGPFREALGSAPQFGDKKTYQMDFRNRLEALKELKLDQNEGADLVMVKPALAYLDVIQSLKRQSLVPVAAYNVSGEYAMKKAAAQKGWLDEKDCALESLTAVKRAGANLIFSYWTPQALNWLQESTQE